MSPAVIIALAVGAIVVLFAVVLLATARKADVRGAGALSRETRRRDRDADIDLPVAPTGKAVERAAVEERTQALDSGYTSGRGRWRARAPSLAFVASVTSALQHRQRA